MPPIRCVVLGCGSEGKKVNRLLPEEFVLKKKEIKQNDVAMICTGCYIANKRRIKMVCSYYVVSELSK